MVSAAAGFTRQNQASRRCGLLGDQRAQAIYRKGLNAVLIDRNRTDPNADPLQPLYDVLGRGDSIIIFPEGTRKAQALPGPFKSGLYHLAAHFPNVALIPVYLENLHRSMPKGTFFPVPLVCAVRFGTPLQRFDHEDKSAFLERARDAIVSLRPMNPAHKLYWLIGGVVALLIVASVVGRILRMRVTDENKAAVMKNLNARVNAWWSMVAVFTAAFLIGKYATIAMFALISFYALREFLTLTPTKIGDHRALSVAFFVMIRIQYVLIAANWYGLFAIFIPVYGFLLLPSVSALAGDTENFLERSAKI